MRWRGGGTRVLWGSRERWHCLSHGRATQRLIGLQPPTVWHSEGVPPLCYACATPTSVVPHMRNSSGAQKAEALKRKIDDLDGIDAQLDAVCLGWGQGQSWGKGTGRCGAEAVAGNGPGEDMGRPCCDARNHGPGQALWQGQGFL